MTFQAYLLSIVGAVVATTLIEVIMAEGETKKFVKGVASVLVLAAIVIPLPSLFSNIKTKSIDELTSDSAVTEVDDTYLQRIYENQYKTKELAVQKKLKYAGFDGVTVRIIIRYTSGGEIEIEQIIIDKSALVITEENANINIDVEIIKIVSTALSVDSSKIIVTG